MRLEDNVVKRVSEFMERGSSLKVTNLPGLVTIGIVVVEMFLINYVAPRDNVLKKLCNFVDGSFS